MYDADQIQTHTFPTLHDFLPHILHTAYIYTLYTQERHTCILYWEKLHNTVHDCINLYTIIYFIDKAFLYTCGYMYAHIYD